MSPEKVISTKVVALFVAALFMGGILGWGMSIAMLGPRIAIIESEEARVLILEDKEAIKDVITTYAHGVDNMDINTLSPLYADDVHWTFAFLDVDISGKEAVEEFFTGTLFAGFTFFKHNILNYDITISEDMATATSYWIVYAVDAEGNAIHSVGTYNWTFEKVGGQWLITYQKLDVDTWTPIEVTLVA